MVWSNFIKFHQTHLWILRLLRTMGKATPGSIHSRCLPHLDNLAIWPPEKGKKPLLHSTATLQRARTTWFLVMGLSEGKVSRNWWFISHSPYALRIQFFGGIPWHSNRPTYTVHQTSSDKKTHSPAWLPQRASLRNVRAAPGSVQGQTVELGKARNNWNIPKHSSGI